MKELTPMQGETPYLSFPSKILYHGRYLGQEVIDGKPGYQVQFDDILDGKGRYLTIHLPARTDSSEYNGDSNTVKILETDRIQHGPPNAYLIYTISRNVRDTLTKDMAEGKPVSLDPYRILKEHFNYTPDKKDYPVVVAVIDKSCPFNDEFFFYYFVWEKGSGKPVVTANSFDRLTDNEGLKELRWIKRNRPLYTAGFLAYPFCVIADIVMLPVYIILFPFLIDSLQNLKS